MKPFLSAVVLAGIQMLCLAEKADFPEFSWETVPVYIHFGKSSGPLTDEEIRFVAATSNFVCLEKGHGRDRFGSTEKGIAYDARRLKAANSSLKVLFYWNSFLNYPLYDACREIQTHPDWIFRDIAGLPIYKVRNLEQYNLLNPQFRTWWAIIAGKSTRTLGCDGIFMDAVNQAKRSIWMKRGWGEGSEDRLTDAVIDMMKQARAKMGESGLIVYNGIRSSDSGETLSGLEYIDHADGVKVEHFTAFNSRSKESVAQDIEAISRAGKAGKMVIVKGWPDPDFTWLNEEKMRTEPAGLAQEARTKITFSLACFLVAAERHSYFCYSWGYRENNGSLVDYPEFHKRLGEPAGDSTREGWTYRRSFEHASVWVDLDRREARIDWK